MQSKSLEQANEFCRAKRLFTDGVDFFVLRDAQAFLLDEDIAVCMTLHGVSLFSYEFRQKIYEQSFAQKYVDVLKLLEKSPQELQSEYYEKLKGNKLATKTFYALMILLFGSQNVCLGNKTKKVSNGLSFVFSTQVSLCKENRVFRSAVEENFSEPLECICEDDLLLLWQLLQLKVYVMYCDVTNRRHLKEIPYHTLDEFQKPYEMCLRIEEELKTRGVDVALPMVENRRRKFNEKVEQLSTISLQFFDAWLMLWLSVTVDITDDNVRVIKSTRRREWKCELKKEEFLTVLKKMNMGIMPRAIRDVDYDIWGLDGGREQLYFKWRDGKKTLLTFEWVRPSALVYFCDYIQEIETKRHADLKFLTADFSLD